MKDDEIALMKALGKNGTVMSVDKIELLYTMVTGGSLELRCQLLAYTYAAGPDRVKLLHAAAETIPVTALPTLFEYVFRPHPHV